MLSTYVVPVDQPLVTMYSIRCPHAPVDAAANNPRLQHLSMDHAGKRKANPLGAKTSSPLGSTPNTDPSDRPADGNCASGRP